MAERPVNGDRLRSESLTLVRAKILGVLEGSKVSLTAQQIGARTGMDQNAVRMAAGRMVRIGWLGSELLGSQPGRQSRLYWLTAEGALMTGGVAERLGPHRPPRSWME